MFRGSFLLRVLALLIDGTRVDPSAASLMGSIGSHRDEGFTGGDNQMRNHTRGDWNEEEGFRTWMMLTVNLAAD